MGLGEGMWKAHILMEGLGRVNLPHFLWSSEGAKARGLSSVLRLSANRFLPPLVPFCY